MIKKRRPWILIAAYDVSSGVTSEGYVAFNLLQRLKNNFRIILVTRKNNRDSLRNDHKAIQALSGIHIIGFDLPKWACWWKRGHHFYFPYAYLWQICWPLALFGAKQLRSKISLCHVLNFHNDSIPSLAWILGAPVIWGPINHNELASAWRRDFWPLKMRAKKCLSFFLRILAWKIDPLLRITKNKASLIFSAGPWVEHRLYLNNDSRIIRLSQLGVDASTFIGISKSINIKSASPNYLLVHAGRIDWIKGLEVTIDALALLPLNFNLLLVGTGPAEQKIRDLVQKRALTNRVTFMLPVAREKLSDIYNKSSLFLFPSAEAGGLAWIEALSCGLPVVGFKENTFLGCVPFTLQGVYLVKPEEDRTKNIHAFAKMILKAVATPQKRQDLSNCALKRFGWEKMASEISENYNKVLLHKTIMSSTDEI